MRYELYEPFVFVILYLKKALFSFKEMFFTNFPLSNSRMGDASEIFSFIMHAFAVPGMKFWETEM